MLYFIKSGEYVKIGVADNPWSRMTGFQIGSPIPLELMAVAPGGFEEEKKYHARLSQYRCRGEWFECNDQLRAVVDSIRAKHPALQERPRYNTTRKRNAAPSLPPVEAVRLVVNTAVAMADNEPAIDVRSVTESRRGPGILIWIPGYVSNGDTIIVASAGRDVAAGMTPEPPQP